MQEILADSALRVKMSEQGRIQSWKFHPNAVREQIGAFWAELAEAAKREQGKDYEAW